MASDDIYELRDQIKSMVATLRNIDEEKRSLTKEAQKYEERCLALKTEANILGALDAVRFHDNEDMSQSNENGLFDKTFLEANLKLDLTILNLELRQNLPKLEKEAIAAEYIYQKEFENLKKQKLRKEHLSVKSEENLTQEVAEILDKRMKMEDLTNKITRDSLGKRRNLSQILIQKRQTLTALEDDYEYHTDRSRRLKKTLLMEQARLDQLVTQHVALRDRLQPYHSGHGWETEAFLSQTGSIAGTMSISQASSVLENWIIPLDLVSLQQGVPLTSLKKVIQKGLEKLRFQKKVELNCEEFILLCRFILDSCGDGGSESVEKDDQSSSGRRER